MDGEPAPSFGEVRERPCPQCGETVIYQYGNWHCVGHLKSGGGYESPCGWTTQSERHKSDGNDGWRTQERCPECDGMIIYNGNYFCEHWGDDCGWALPSPALREADQDLALRLTGRNS